MLARELGLVLVRGVGLQLRRPRGLSMRQLKAVRDHRRIARDDQREREKDEDHDDAYQESVAARTGLRADFVAASTNHCTRPQAQAVTRKAGRPLRRSGA